MNKQKIARELVKIAKTIKIGFFSRAGEAKAWLKIIERMTFTVVI
jgi:hypothetical protein